MSAEKVNLIPGTNMQAQLRARLNWLKSQARSPGMWVEHTLRRDHGVHYVILSRAGAAEGGNAAAVPTFLLVHGYGHGETAFYPLVKKLAEAGKNVAAMSWRGHGLSSQMTEAELNQCGVKHFTEDVVAVAKDIPGKVTLVGHSLGGVIAMHAAAELGSEKVASIDLLCPVPSRPARMRLSPRVLWFFTPYSGVMFSLHGPATDLSSTMLASLLFNGGLTPVELEEKLSELQPESRLAGRQIFGAGIFSLIAGRTEYPEKLPAEVPVRIIAAEEDRIILMPTATALHTYLISRGITAQLQSIPGPHDVMWVNPQSVANVLLR